MTVGDALERGKQAGGGSILAVFGWCLEMNYNASITCYDDTAYKAVQSAAETASQMHQRRRLQEAASPNGTLAQPGSEAGVAPAVTTARRLGWDPHATCYGHMAFRHRAFGRLWKYMDDLTNT